MWRHLRSWLARRAFERATRALDAEIAAVRAKHGKVSEAEARKTAALHKALAEAVRQ